MAEKTDTERLNETLEALAAAQVAIHERDEALEVEKAKNTDKLKTIKEMQATIDSIVPPEAVYSFSTNALSHEGLGGMWTIRARVGETAAQFYARVDTVLQSLSKHGWTTPQKAPAATVDNTAPQTAPAPSAAPAPQGIVGEGACTAVLMKVGTSFVAKKPQLIFEVKEQDDPLKFTGKTFEDLVQFLRPVGQFTTGHLTIGARFTVDYVLHWKLSDPNDKGKRYQDIVSIEASKAK